MRTGRESMGSNSLRWAEVEKLAPGLCRCVRTRMNAHVHKTLGTLRRDGSPRLSGTECLFVGGDLWFGSMWQARKARDLQRDPRFVLHSGSDDPPAWKGDAKIRGLAEEITNRDVMARVFTALPEGPVHLFRADITELVTVSIARNHRDLVIDIWDEERGVRKMERPG